MRELVYADTRAEKVIKDKWPEAKIVDASDAIHEERFEVEVDATEDEFYPFAIQEGFALCCLGLQVMIMKGKEHKADIERWIGLAGIKD